MNWSAMELFRRSASNPLLTAADWPYPVNSVFNPAATLIDGETLLLCRVEDRRGISHLTVARSADGVTGWRVEPQPLIAPDPDDPVSMWGVEDARITRVDELDMWLIAYTEYGRKGPCVALATTTDFKTVQRIGVAVPPEDKNACLLPRRIDGHYVLFHRPVSPITGRADVWVSRSTDLRWWAEAREVLRTREGAWWDSVRIGIGPPPLWTADGWLVFYHGVKTMVDKPVYRVGVALLDHDDPARILCRADEWVLSPSAPYELGGDAPTVVFPTGLVHDEATDELRLYYGAADTCVALATAQLSDMLAWLSRSNHAAG